jgi:hypothetical protein
VVGTHDSADVGVISVGILTTMTLTPQDEGLHPAGDDLDWQESVYLGWRDAQAGLGGNHRIGNELNRGTANVWCGVYQDDGTRFRHNAEQLPLVRLEHPGLSGGPQQLFLDNEVLRFVLDGDGCRMDLEIVDDPASLVDSTGEAFAGSKGAAGAIFSSNFHVFCRVRGTVTLEGRASRIDAPAWRDHSWGVRRWDSFLASRSLGGSFGDSLQFNYGSMVGVNGSFFRHGSLVREGQRLPVASATMLVNVDDDSMRCPEAEVRYCMADGETTSIRIETIGGMIGVTGTRYGWESVGDVSVDGQPGGWGFLEVNNNPRNGHDPPTFVLSEALTNGIVNGAASGAPDRG